MNAYDIVGGPQSVSDKRQGAKTMTDDLDALCALEEAMTPGPWRQRGLHDDGTVRDAHYAREVGPAWISSGLDAQAHADARGIAVLRNLAKPLLKYVAALEARHAKASVGTADRLYLARRAFRDALRREMGGEP